MAKKKTKRRRSRQAAERQIEPQAGGLFTGKRLFQGGLVVVAGIAAWFFWQSMDAESKFMSLAESGRSQLSAVKTLTDLGGGHAGAGEQLRYPNRFPTSGRHHPRWTETGFHTTPQFAAQLVHALEHGNIVIYYDSPGAEVLRTIEAWAGLYRGQWSGLVATPAAGLGKAVVLTAWRQSLRLDPFDAATAAAFIDKYRGRGPEHPVR